MSLLGIQIPFMQSCSMCGEATTAMFCERCKLTLKLLEVDLCQDKSGAPEENTGLTPKTSTGETHGVSSAKGSMGVRFITFG